MAIKATANGACLFNAVCTASWGEGMGAPDETDPIALSLRVALLVHGIVHLEKHVGGDPTSFLRSRYAYDGKVLDQA